MPRVRRAEASKPAVFIAQRAARARFARLSSEFFVERDGEELEDLAKRGAMAIGGQRDGGVEAARRELQTDAVDEPTNASILLKSRGVDVEELKESAEKRVDGVRDAFEGPYEESERRREEKYKKRGRKEPEREETTASRAPASITQSTESQTRA